jgi:hypothetical protein
VTKSRKGGKLFSSQISTKISTNFNSAGLSVQRANQAVFDAYQNDLIDRADIYELCLHALDTLCVDGDLVGKIR